MSDLPQVNSSSLSPVGHGVMASLPSQGGQHVTFYQRDVVNEYESREKGRPIYRSADYVRILTPGERDEIDREALPADRARWAPIFEAYKANKEAPQEGTALTALFPHKPEVVDLLKSQKCLSVEQLAELSDTSCQNMGLGVADWRNMAKRYLDLSKDAGRFQKIEMRQDALEFENKNLTEQLAALKAENDHLKADKAVRERKAA